MKDTKKDKKPTAAEVNKAMQRLAMTSNEIPQSLLDQLSEHTGGYLLLSINAENNSVINFNVDNEAAASLLINLAARWGGVMQQIEHQNFQSNFFGPDEDRDENCPNHS